MEKLISVVIPAYNSSATIGTCLDAVFRSDYKNFEVIVVDDGSSDNTAQIARGFPCRVISHPRNFLEGKARNTGAFSSHGDLLFFTDSDCIVRKETLTLIDKAFSDLRDKRTVIGGTYTTLPYDQDFFSVFQSLFIHYFETKTNSPDYLAAHALAIDAALFRESGGFIEDNFLPILHDVEFSHRLRKAGCTLEMHPEIAVQHIFNFSFVKSLKNAFRKSKYWTAYSLRNRDILRDSGTASHELKINCFLFLLSALCLLLGLASGENILSILPLLLLTANYIVNRKLFFLLFSSKGTAFALRGAFFYMLIYPIPVIAGALAGTLHHVTNASPPGVR